MIIHNRLPHLLECLRRWENPPTVRQYREEYAAPLADVADGFFGNLGGAIADLDWVSYRAEALRIDSTAEEKRLRGHLADVERLFGFTLEGEAILCGAFAAMDGFARFDRGQHQVFLGIDESHGRGRYLDVLETHELTHVARETRPEVWTGWGLDPKMPRAAFLDSVPAVEHLMNEGLSCVVSELLVPGQPAGSYAYQSPEGLARVLSHASAVDRVIHAELAAPDGGDYGRFYDTRLYGPELPDYAHYVWAWRWVSSLLADPAIGGGDPRRLVALCSRELRDLALDFRIGRSFW